MINSLMSGFVYKKSGSWTEYFKIWGNATWKKKFLVLTNVGLLVFDQSQIGLFRKPSKFISLVGIGVTSGINEREVSVLKGDNSFLSNEKIFKVTDQNLYELVLATESTEET